MGGKWQYMESAEVVCNSNSKKREYQQDELCYIGEDEQGAMLNDREK